MGTSSYIACRQGIVYQHPLCRIRRMLFELFSSASRLGHGPLRAMLPDHARCTPLPAMAAPAAEAPNNEPPPSTAALACTESKNRFSGPWCSRASSLAAPPRLAASLGSEGIGMRAARAARRGNAWMQRRVSVTAGTAAAAAAILSAQHHPDMHVYGICSRVYMVLLGSCV